MLHGRYSWAATQYSTARDDTSCFIVQLYGLSLEVAGAVSNALFHVYSTNHFPRGKRRNTRTNQCQSSEHYKD